MIELPDIEKSFQYENNFFLSCSSSRIGKIIAHYELYKKIIKLGGAIVECGVFKGLSLIRFAAFRDLFETSHSRDIIGFDVFDKFPKASNLDDERFRKRFVNEAGEESISKEQLLEVLSNKGLNQNIDLIEGDVCQTVPAYVNENPQLKISLLHIDIDTYEPSLVILEYLYPRVVTNGIIILDDYGTFPGETKAVDEFFDDNKQQIYKLPFARTPCYMIKE